jgi:hypothetical protein
LARFHEIPSRFKANRMHSPLTCRGVRPSSKLTSAASSKVHRLVSLPKSRGLRWSSSFNRSACSSPTNGWTVLGRREPACRAATPRSLKALMALRTVCSPHPANSAMCGAVSPRELARTIWQRRTVNGSDDLNPLANSRSSSSLSSCTKIGFPMPSTIPLSTLSCL